MIRRLLAVLHARNIEFLRDRSSLGWNIVLPVLLVFGLAFIFSGGGRPLFKVGVLQSSGELDSAAHPFLETQYIDFFLVSDQDDATRKVSRHQLDMLLDLRAQPRYWVNPDSPKGYLLERLVREADPGGLQRETISGTPVRYIDWLLPGILGMNMMFSCLFGVGYVVVRYRKNGFLKRLRATPLRAIEFIGAQVVSRLLLIMVITVVVYVGTSYLIGFRMEGSHWSLLVVAIAGAVSMISLGLVVAARVNSEELAGGILNMITWPMMLLSGVWFSLEGTNPILQHGSRLLPLTQLLDAARAIMLDGEGLAGVWTQLTALTVMSILFIAAGAALFRWRTD